jgi:hypothetical protein
MLFNLRRSALLLVLTLSAASTAIAQDATPAATPAATVAAQPADTAQPVATNAATPVAAAAPETAPAAIEAAAGSVGAPPAGKGQIVFFRPSKFAGAAIGFKVREGDAELGKLRSGNYFVANVDPGTHVYTVHSEAKDVLTMEVEAGETYYVEGTISMGFMVGHPNLSPSDQATFNGMSAKLKRVQ